MRPGSKGSIIVDIEGAPKNLKELAEELKTENSFVLQGYAELTIDKVFIYKGFISGTPTTKSPLEEIKEDSEDIGANIFKILTQDGSINFSV